MGFWGSALYSNDCARDVKAYYLSILKEHSDIEDISEQVITHFREFLGTEEEPLFWYALSDIQWQMGRLNPSVQQKALEWLQQNGGLNFWEDSPGGGIGWKKTMERLYKRLNAPQPSPKRIKQENVLTNPWNVGDIYAYRFHTDKAVELGCFQKYILIQKIGDSMYMDGRILSHVRVFDKLFDDVPTLTHLSNIRVLPLDNPERFMPSGRAYPFPKLRMGITLELNTSRQYPRKHLVYVGQYSVPENVPIKTSWGNVFFWCSMEREWIFFHNMWKTYHYRCLSHESVVLKREDSQV